MTLQEQQLAVCEKLPELVIKQRFGNGYAWANQFWTYGIGEINWQLEGLQVCHEAEKLLDKHECYIELLIELHCQLYKISSKDKLTSAECAWIVITSPYEQRLEALCRVWWPEKWKE